MEENLFKNMIGVNYELLSILIKNPFLSRPEDEIGETSLVKWVGKEYKSQMGETIKKQDIYGLITKLTLERVFIAKRYGQRVLLKPTQNYYLLKSGKPMVQRKRAKTQVSLFTDEGNKLFVSKDETPKTAEVQTTTNNLSEGQILFQTSSIDNISYNKLLLEKVSHYNGPDKHLVEYFPQFFNLACNILNDKYTDWHTKLLISSALGYFVLEEDVIPDNTEFGYLDDLYILCYVLREIKRHVSPSLLEENWDYSENVHDLIEEVYQDTYVVIQDFACEILHKVGLRKFKQFDLEEYSGTYPDKIAKLAQEKRELIGLSTYLIKIIYNTNFDGRSLKKIKDFLMRYGDYTEIVRLIELSNRDYETERAPDSSIESFEAKLENELHQARLRALLEDQETD